MADFCNECAVLIGFEPGDMAGLCDPGMWRLVLCESCGPIYVDHTGRCMTEDCDGATQPYGHRVPSSREVLRRHAEWAGRRSGPLGRLWRLRDRLLGSPYAPGLIHEWRWHYHDWLDRRRRVSDDHFTTDFFERWTAPSKPDFVIEEPSATGVEAPRRTVGGPAKTGVPGEEDQ